MGIIVKKVKPIFDKIITTADMYTEQTVMENGLIDTSKTKQGLKEYQTVVAVGDSVRCVKVGDLVCINPSAYAVRKYDPNSVKAGMKDTYNSVTTYIFNFIETSEGKFLKISDRDIDFVVEEYETTPDTLVDEGTSLATFN